MPVYSIQYSSSKTIVKHFKTGINGRGFRHNETRSSGKTSSWGLLSAATTVALLEQQPLRLQGTANNVDMDVNSPVRFCGEHALVGLELLKGLLPSKRSSLTVVEARATTICQL